MLVKTSSSKLKFSLTGHALVVTTLVCISSLLGNSTAAQAAEMAAPALPAAPMTAGSMNVQPGMMNAQPGMMGVAQNGAMRPQGMNGSDSSANMRNNTQQALSGSFEPLPNSRMPMQPMPSSSQDMPDSGNTFDNAQSTPAQADFVSAPNNDMVSGSGTLNDDNAQPFPDEDNAPNAAMQYGPASKSGGADDDLQSYGPNPAPNAPDDNSSGDFAGDDASSGLGNDDQNPIGNSNNSMNINPLGAPSMNEGMKQQSPITPADSPFVGVQDFGPEAASAPQNGSDSQDPFGDDDPAPLGAAQ